MKTSLYLLLLIVVHAVGAQTRYIVYSTQEVTVPITMDSVAWLRAQEITNLAAATSQAATSSLPSLSFTGPSVTLTNWVSGQVYTNTSGRLMYVRSAAILTTAAVAGNATMVLESGDQGSARAVRSIAGIATTALSIVMTYTNEIGCYLTNNSVFTFTNKSSGIGESSALINGTGQQITF